MRGRNSTLALVLVLLLATSCGPSKEEKERAAAMAKLQQNAEQADRELAKAKRNLELSDEIDKLKWQLELLEQKLLDHDDKTDKLVHEVERDIIKEKARFKIEQEEVRHKNAMALLKIERMEITKQINSIERATLESKENARYIEEKSGCIARHEARKLDLKQELTMIKSARRAQRSSLNRELEPERTKIQSRIAENEKIIGE